MTKGGSAKIVNFMTPRTVVLVLGLDHNKIHYFCKILLFYSTQRSDKGFK